jgi:photosystem II stability/assembly factor-like uncharacterized protein
MKSANRYKESTMENFNRYAAFSLRAVLAATIVMFGIIRSNDYVTRAAPSAFAADKPGPGVLQWRQTSGPEGAVINCLLSNGPNLFAGTSAGGVFRSTNQGESWTSINARLPVDANVTVFAVSGTNLFAGTTRTLSGRGVGGVFRSTDQGENWTEVNTGLLEEANVTALVADGPNLFAALSQNQSIYSAVFRSTDQGESWTPVGDGLPQISRVSLLAVVGPNLFAVSDTPDGSAVYRSGDQGESWTQVGAGLPPGPSVSSFAAVGPKLFAAAPGGVFLSTDQGESWIADNAGLNGLGVRALAVAGEKLFAGTFGSGVFVADVKQ